MMSTVPAAIAVAVAIIGCFYALNNSLERRVSEELAARKGAA